MKKVIAFLLAAVMCLGFVGCELPGMGLARKIVGKTASAEEIFKELAKEGELIKDTYIEGIYSQSGSGVNNVNTLIFRIPKEKRDSSTERACFIEIYENEDGLNKSVDKYNSMGREVNYYMYSSGTVLLLLDSVLSADVVEKYFKAFKKATAKKVQVRQTRPLYKNKIYYFDFSITNGIGAEKVFYGLKESIDNIEFFSFNKYKDREVIISELRTKNNLTYVLEISAYTSNSAALEVKKEYTKPYDGKGLKRYLFISGNIVINCTFSLPEGSEGQIKEALSQITGQTVEVSYR